MSKYLEAHYNFAQFLNGKNLHDTYTHDSVKWSVEANLIAQSYSQAYSDVLRKNHMVK